MLYDNLDDKFPPFFTLSTILFSWYCDIFCDSKQNDGYLGTQVFNILLSNSITFSFLILNHLNEKHWKSQFKSCTIVTFVLTIFSLAKIEGNLNWTRSKGFLLNFCFEYVHYRWFLFFVSINYIRRRRESPSYPLFDMIWRHQAQSQQNFQNFFLFLPIFTVWNSTRNVLKE